MLYFEDVNDLYYKKFGDFLSIPINGFPPNITMQDFLDECMRCIENNIEFDGSKFYGNLPDDCVE